MFEFNVIWRKRDKKVQMCAGQTDCWLTDRQIFASDLSLLIKDICKKMDENKKSQYAYAVSWVPICVDLTGIYVGPLVNMNQTNMHEINVPFALSLYYDWIGWNCPALPKSPQHTPLGDNELIFQFLEKLEKLLNNREKQQVSRLLFWCSSYIF